MGTRRDAERICKPVTVDDLHRSCVFDVATTGDKTLCRLSAAGGSGSTAPRSRSAATRSGPAWRGGRRHGHRDRNDQKEADTHGQHHVPDRRRPGRTANGAGQTGSGHVEDRELERGVRRIRALYTPGGKTGFYHKSSSPVLRHRVESNLRQAKAPYRLSGIFYEACDCFTICPCWLGDSRRRRVHRCFRLAGREGHDRRRRRLRAARVSVSHHSGLREEARQRVVIFVDDRATRQQADALAAAFSGRLGGPLKELADLRASCSGWSERPSRFVVKAD